MSVWKDTTDVVWYDTVDCIWKDIAFLEAAVGQDEFDDEAFENVTDVTPSDTTILGGFIYVGSTGIVKVLSAHNDKEMIFEVLTAGSFIKMKIKKVFLSNTTATDIVLVN